MPVEFEGDWGGQNGVAREEDEGEGGSNGTPNSIATFRFANLPP